MHEIYGINAHIRAICNDFAAHGFDVLCPNLLPTDRVYAYSEAAEAHQDFMLQVGFISAQQQVDSLCSKFRNRYATLFLIGFSIGATVAWLCSQSGTYNGIVGYYGSRIRDYTQLVPRTPVLLFFPSHEAAFSVDALVSELSKRENIQIQRTPALHGFADPYSDTYCQEARQVSMRRTLAFLSGG